MAAASLSVFFFSFVLFGSSFAKIPEAKCSLKDKNLDNCLKDSINGLIPVLASEGVPEVNLGRLDPMKMGDLLIKPRGKVVKGTLQLKDMVVVGLKGTEIKSLRSDLDKKVGQTLEGKITNPKLIITGKYKGALSVETLNISGNGQFKLILKDIKVTGKLVADTVKGKNNADYFTVKSIDVVPDVGSLKLNATNLFDKNTAMAKMVLGLINGENWRTYYNLVLPLVKPYLEQYIKDEINVYTTKIPADKIVKP